MSHERLEVYQLAIEFVGWSRRLRARRRVSRSMVYQLERASMSIPLNIAEGNSRASRKDRARIWQLALGSAFECAAIVDVLAAAETDPPKLLAEGKDLLTQIVSMLMAMLKKLGCEVAG